MQREALHGGLHIPHHGINTRNVLGDGNCMFHAFGKEVQDHFAASLPSDYRPSDEPGPYWREFMLKYVESTRGNIDGISVQEGIAIRVKLKGCSGEFINGSVYV